MIPIESKYSIRCTLSHIYDTQDLTFHALFLALIFLLTSCSNLSPSDASSHQASAISFSVVEAFDEFQHINGGFGEFWMPEIMGGGSGLVDFDGDGWLDVLLVGGGSLPSRPLQMVPALSIYKNLGHAENGALTFDDVTAQAGLSTTYAYGFGLSAADYDNDGDTDLFLTTLEQNLLFLNEAGTFREFGSEAGLADNNAWSTSALFFDANRDGHLDVYVTNYLDWSPEQDISCSPTGKRDYCNPLNYQGLEDVYYQNNGDGTFTPRTYEAGFSAIESPRKGKGLGVTELDYNNDGWPDLYVANDGQANFLFRNNQDGTFSEVGVTSGVAYDQNGTTRAGMGVDAGVVDSTGKVSVFVGNFSEEMVGIWRNDTSSLFTNRSATSKVGFPTLPTLTFGLSLADFDLDTDLDLMLLNGHVITYISEQQAGVSFEQPPQLFVNQGDGIFDLVRYDNSVLQEPIVGRGLAVGDVDRDGDIDLLMTENNGPVRLLQNNRAENGFLHLTLEGTESNRDALGARIRASVSGLTMERRIRTGGSYLSQSEQPVTFGLDQHQAVSLLEIQWPSGRVDRFEDVPANQRLSLKEGDKELLSNGVSSVSMSYPPASSVSFIESAADSLLDSYKIELEADSNNARTHFMYSQLLEQLGNYEQALYHSQKALSLDPENANYTFVVGALLFRAGQLERARPYLEQAVASLPSFYPAQYTMGQYLLRVGHTEQAQHHLAQADTARALFQQITQIERAINRFPNEASYRIHLGALYHQASMYNRAIFAFEIAARLDPKESEAYFGLGKSELALGNTAKALVQFQRVVRIDPSNLEAWLSLGLTYSITGNCTEARSAWSEVLSRDPENTSAKSYLEGLCAYRG